MAQLAGGEPASPPRHEFTNDVVVNTGTDARTEGSHTTTAADICKEDVGSNCSDQAEDDELKGGTDDQKFEGRQCDKNVKIIQSPKIEFTCDICGKELKSSKSNESFYANLNTNSLDSFNYEISNNKNEAAQSSIN